MTVDEILSCFQSQFNPANLEGMRRYGIDVEPAYGTSAPALRSLAKRIGADHSLALELWATGVHDARHLAAMIEDPRVVTPVQMDRWAADFRSWDLCDGCCNNLFRKTPHAHSKVVEWSGRTEEFVRRAAFSLMASLAVHDKTCPDAVFIDYLELIRAGTDDERNLVKKAVNWALRQVGKRNLELHSRALELAYQIVTVKSKSARWIAKDAIRELEAAATRARVHKKEKPSGKRP